jgi:hypothetical protein
MSIMYSEDQGALFKEGSPSTLAALQRIKVVLFIVPVVIVASIGLAIPVLIYAHNTTDFFSSDRLDNPVDESLRRLINRTGEFVLPTRFIVPSKYLVPASDQGNRGTCWGFGAINLLESQYRARGIDLGFLTADEYVSFSKQAYMKFLLDRCSHRQDVTPCQHGGFGTNSTEDHKLDAIYYFLKAFPDLAKSVLPESVCPYQTQPEWQDNCTGMETAIQSNPITFSIKQIEAAGDIEGAKRLLVKAGRPIGIGLPIDNYRYYAPCDSSNYSHFPACVNRTTLCPAGYTSTYCYQLTLDTRTRDGIFAYVEDVARARMSGGHAMNILGYNDDYVYHSRKSSARGIAPIRGGFIMHNSWAEPGHSVEYLAGRQSEENEAVQCPNHASPTNWIPTTAADVRAAGGNITACPTKIERVRGFGRTRHPDVLVCLNSLYCNTSRKYALAQLNNDVDAQALFSGLDRVRFISWTSGDDVIEEFFDYFPFFALGRIFRPADLVPNREGLCGYWMYPYNAIALANRVQWSLIDTFHVTDIVFEFTNESYARASRAPGKDYALLINSTHTYKRVEFDGPLPYNYVY